MVFQLNSNFHAELVLDDFLIILGLLIRLDYVLEDSGFSKVVLSEDELTLASLADVAHVLEFAQGCDEHVSHNHIGVKGVLLDGILFLVVLEQDFVSPHAFLQDCAEQLVHLVDVDVLAEVFHDLE